MNRSSLALWLICGGVGCDAAPAPQDELAAGSDTAGSGVTVEEPIPGWSADAVVAAVDDALGTGFPDPFVPQEAYFARMALGDAWCPGDDVQLTDSVLYGCMTEGGTWFEGIAEFQRVEGEAAASMGLSVFEVLAGDFIITTVDGLSLRVGGGALWTRSLPDGATPGPWSMEFGGSWTDEAREDWLGQGASMVLYVEGTAPEAGGELWIDGGVGIGDHDLFFEDLSWTPETCALPAGRVSVRGPDTWWYTLDYPVGCGGCAAVRFQDGQRLGEHCGSLDDLYDHVMAQVEGR